LAGALTQLPHRLADTADHLVEVPGRLPGALSDALHRLSGSLPELADGLACSLAHLADGLPGALADLRQGLLGSLADVLDGFAALAKGVTGARADVLDRLAEALDQLRVAVDGGHYPVDDGCDVIQTHLDQRLGLHARDVDAKLSEVYVYAHRQIHQLEHLRLEGDVGVEIVELEVDLVHLDHGDVEEDVGIASGLAGVFGRV
jgi:hypothetical protein